MSGGRGSASATARDPSDSGSLDLLRHARARDEDASRMLLARMREPLLARIRLMMGQGVRRQAESQDFLQQVMVEFLAASPTPELETEQDLLRWLTAIARSRIRDVGRNRRAIAFDSLSASFSADDVEAVHPSPPSEIGLHEDALRLVEALESLSESYHRVIELHDLEGLSLRETAERMGRSYEAAKRLHGRAMVELASAIASSEP